MALVVLVVWRLSLGDKAVSLFFDRKGTSNSVEYSMGKKVPTQEQQVQRTTASLDGVDLLGRGILVPVFNGK